MLNWSADDFQRDGSYTFAVQFFFPLRSLLALIDVDVSQYGTELDGAFYSINFLFYCGACALIYASTIRAARTREFNLAGLFVLAAYFVLVGPYLALLTKDHITMAATLIVVLSLRNARYYLIFTSVFVLLAVFFRGYYFVFIFATIWLTLLRFKPLIGAGAGAFGIIAIFLIFRLGHLEDYIDFRAIINESFEATTVIVDRFDVSTPVGFISNTFVKFFIILFPLDTLDLGARYYPYVGLRSILSTVAVYQYLHARDTVGHRAACLYLGFAIAGATFEPDHGSVLRHSIGLLPAVPFLLSKSREVSYSTYRRKLQRGHRHFFNDVGRRV